MLRVTVCRRIYQKEFILVITLYITRLVEASLSTPFSWEGFLVYTCASLVYHSLTVLLLRVPTDAVVTATGPGIRHCDWLLRVPVLRHDRSSGLKWRHVVQLRLLLVPVDASDLAFSGGDLCLTLGEDEAGSRTPEAESFSVFQSLKYCVF